MVAFEAPRRLGSARTLTKTTSLPSVARRAVAWRLGVGHRTGPRAVERIEPVAMGGAPVEPVGPVPNPSKFPPIKTAKKNFPIPHEFASDHGPSWIAPRPYKNDPPPPPWRVRRQPRPSAVVLLLGVRWPAWRGRRPLLGMGGRPIA